MSSSSESELSNDDFARLDPNHRPAAAPVSFPQRGPLTPPFLNDTQSVVQTSTVTQPLLPRAAEAELYLLATNFLLYVAMVLIITLVARIYFPEAALRTRATSFASAPQQHNAPTRHSSFSLEEANNDEKQKQQSLSADAVLIDTPPLVHTADNITTQQGPLEHEHAHLLPQKKKRRKKTRKLPWVQV